MTWQPNTGSSLTLDDRVKFATQRVGADPAGISSENQDSQRTRGPSMANYGVQVSSVTASDTVLWSKEIRPDGTLKV